ncbi:uncharacterized protein DDB_G0286299-like [Argopecten irradians]|uniref:uncharacterized protein DDB_G0286299-like n=1 Tax=Argopecten irradians TaxID=31199 RepID=UPI00371E0DDB
MDEYNAICCDGVAKETDDDTENETLGSSKKSSNPEDLHQFTAPKEKTEPDEKDTAILELKDDLASPETPCEAVAKATDDDTENETLGGLTKSTNPQDLHQSTDKPVIIKNKKKKKKKAKDKNDDGVAKETDDDTENETLGGSKKSSNPEDLHQFTAPKEKTEPDEKDTAILELKDDLASPETPCEAVAKATDDDTENETLGGLTKSTNPQDLHQSTDKPVIIKKKKKKKKKTKDKNDDGVAKETDDDTENETLGGSKKSSNPEDLHQFTAPKEQTEQDEKDTAILEPKDDVASPETPCEGVAKETDDDTENETLGCSKKSSNPQDLHQFTAPKEKTEPDEKDTAILELKDDLASPETPCEAVAKATDDDTENETLGGLTKSTNPQDLHQSTDKPVIIKKKKKKKKKSKDKNDDAPKEKTEPDEKDTPILKHKDDLASPETPCEDKPVIIKNKMKKRRKKAKDKNDDGLYGDRTTIQVIACGMAMQIMSHVKNHIMKIY